MSFLDKAKELSSRVVKKTVQFSSDKVIADTIIKAVDKQEKVNTILKKRGSNYRVSSLNLAMSIPPGVSFGIRRIKDGNEDEEAGRE